MNDKQVITATKAMEMLGISRAQLSRLIRARQIDGYKLTPGVRNSPYRVYIDSVRKFIRQRHVVN